MSETATAKSPNTVGALMPVDVANDSITILEFHDGRMASYKNDGVIGLKTVHILKPIVIKGEEV
ncbi:MAG TPA: hypothetical protein PKD34_02620, partial [Candidatus Doudnabacteria bacterium]|nr:hypothetical protein [Candidatus Doudnabacteria bacterium]